MAKKTTKLSVVPSNQPSEAEKLEKLFKKPEEMTPEAIAAQMEHELNSKRIFQKIKFNGKTVTIQFINKKTNDKTLLEADDEPLDTFKDALQELKFYFINIAELSSTDTVEIRALSLSQNNDNEQLAIITGLKTLKTGKKILINTPLTHEKEWSAALAEAIEKLEYQASLYADGHRKYKQETLFDEDFDQEGD